MPLALCTICTRHNHVLAQTNNNAGKNCGIVIHMNIVLFLKRRWFLNSSLAQHMDCNGLQTQMAHVCFYISAVVGGIDFIDKLVLLFLRLFLLSRNAFGDEFLMAEVFYREHWSNLYHKLQNKSKSEIKEPISVGRRVCSCCSLCVGRPFQFGFLPSKPCFLFYTKIVSQCYMKVSFIPFFRPSLWLAVVRPWQRHQWLGWKW